MTQTPTQALRAFHTAIGEQPPAHPTLISAQHFAFRRRLLEEEWAEVQAELDTVQGLLAEAELTGTDITGPVEALAPLVHELTDLLYVTYGTLVQMGVNADAAFAAIHAANMSKLGGPLRQDGKLLKPKDWQPADMGAVLRGQMPSD